MVEAVISLPRFKRRDMDLIPEGRVSERLQPFKKKTLQVGIFTIGFRDPVGNHRWLSKV